jgi:hypothetical protein
MTAASTMIGRPARHRRRPGLLRWIDGAYRWVRPRIDVMGIFNLVASIMLIWTVSIAITYIAAAWIGVPFDIL